MAPCAGKGLMFLLNLFTAVALIFEGYNQGVLGTVSKTPGFIAMAKIGANGKVTDTTKQGGLAAAYYFGAMWGYWRFVFLTGPLASSGLTQAQAGSVTNWAAKGVSGLARSSACWALP
jgi:hypothetical protein